MKNRYFVINAAGEAFTTVEFDETVTEKEILEVLINKRMFHQKIKLYKIKEKGKRNGRK